MFYMQENYFELINTCFLDIWQRNNSELFSWLCNQSEATLATNQNQEESNTVSDWIQSLWKHVVNSSLEDKFYQAG